MCANLQKIHNTNKNNVALTDIFIHVFDNITSSHGQCLMGYWSNQWIWVNGITFRASHIDVHIKSGFMDYPNPLLPRWDEFGLRSSLPNLIHSWTNVYIFFFSKLLDPHEVNISGITWIRNDARLCFTAPKQWTTLQISDVDLDQESTKCETEIKTMYWISNKARI